MIDINELRRKLHSGDLIDHIDIHANVKPVLTEILDRIEAAEKERESWKGLAQQFGNELDTVRAKVEQMEKQEPVGTLHDDGCFVWSTTRPYESNYAGWKMKLYLAPGAKGEEK